MIPRTGVLTGVIWLAVTATDGTSQQISKISDSVVEPEALTIHGSFGQRINGLSFQQDAIATHGQYQYVAYYDAGRRVCVAQTKIAGWFLEVLRFEDYDFQSNDAHNTISLGICPQDGTIHLAFDHHGHPLHYRVSHPEVARQPETFAWEADLFGPIRSELELGKPIRITYPRFWQTPEGGLQFGYRQGGSGNGDRMLVDYDAAAGCWHHTRQIDSHAGDFQDAVDASRSRCSYPNGYDYGPLGKLHTTWVWREDAQGANHDLMYCYSEDRGVTWKNNQGQVITGPARVDTPGITVVKIDRTLGLMNTHGQAIDSLGRVHVVMWHCTESSLAAAGSRPGEQRWGPPEAHRYHHYWRDEGGMWQHRELNWVAGNRPKLFFDRHDNAYLIFSVTYAAAEPSEDITGQVGDLVIATATGATGWTDWRRVHVERGPFVNEMLGDRYRWRQEGVLSVLVQDAPPQIDAPTPLRIVDFAVDASR